MSPSRLTKERNPNMVSHRSPTLLCIGMMLAVLPVLSCARESGLRFSPETPVAGSVVTVRYSPVAALADEAELVLRGTYRTTDDQPWGSSTRLHNPA